jgi:hypothetical protein
VSAPKKPAAAPTKPATAQAKEENKKPEPELPPGYFDERTLDELAERLKNGEYKNIAIMAGAGISVSAGIPDFRSPGCGLYS